MYKNEQKKVYEYVKPYYGEKEDNSGGRSNGVEKGDIKDF